MLSRNYVVIIERYAWSGTAYSWASDPSADPRQYMILDAGLPQPDLVICIETPFSDILSRGASVFVDIDFQQKLRTCYADPRIWKGINVMVQSIPLEETTGAQGEPINAPPGEGSLVDLRDPYLEIVLDTGSIPCSIHGYDHLSRCEFCKRALGPLYRHLSKKYGQSLGDQTPTLSFDFSGPHPVAVTGARFMLLFVWRLDSVRLLWAFAVTGKTKECVRSCLNDVVAELNTYTGGSKPPALKIHSDQAREFLSQPVMEWLMRHNIKQTFTSTGDPSANGVAKRWIDLVKVKATR